MNNIDNKKTRDANFELLRIIAMIMIIILHFNNGGNNILISVDKNSMQWYFFYFLEYSCNNSCKFVCNDIWILYDKI